MVLVMFTVISFHFSLNRCNWTSLNIHGNCSVICCNDAGIDIHHSPCKWLPCLLIQKMHVIGMCNAINLLCWMVTSCSYGGMGDNLSPLAHVWADTFGFFLLWFVWHTYSYVLYASQVLNFHSLHDYQHEAIHLIDTIFHIYLLHCHWHNYVSNHYNYLFGHELILYHLLLQL